MFCWTFNLRFNNWHLYIRFRQVGLPLMRLRKVRRLRHTFKLRFNSLTINLTFSAKVGTAVPTETRYLFLPYIPAIFWFSQVLPVPVLLDTSQSTIALKLQCTNAGRDGSLQTKFCTGVCGPSVWHFLYVIPLAPRILMLLLGIFENVCTPAVNCHLLFMY